jgi:amidohydrolase
MSNATAGDPVMASIAAAVSANRTEIVDLAHWIHAHPEPGFEERESSGRVAEVLARHGYAVERPAGSLETAIRARIRGTGAASGDRTDGAGSGHRATGGHSAADGPTIAILAEYDSLRGLGHGCGHNLISAAGVGAAIALAATRDQWHGEVVFMGTPAEEDLAGKQVMIDDGLFEGVDAAMMIHASNRTQVELELLASVDARVTYTGLQAHASTDPWRGRNALDALLLLFQSVGLWRQQLRPDARVHGIVTDGGSAVNIIPAEATGHFRLRSADQKHHDEMAERFRSMVEAAALATGCTGEVTFFSRATTMRHNRTIGARFAEHLAAAGVADGSLSPRLGSSDIGNVSMVVPTIHPMLGIVDGPVPLHSVAFREAAATPRADEMALIGATCLAQTAAELLADPKLVADAWAEFREGAAG